MTKLVSPILVTVEFITEVKEGQYGPYCSVLFKDETGEKIWKSFDPDSEELARLSKGARVQLIPAGERNGKPSHNILLLDTPAIPEGMSQRDILVIVEQHADLLRFCLETAQRKFGDLVEPEDIRVLATTLFISAMKEGQP